jgi:two-component system chemotaxis response regulator CheY
MLRNVSALVVEDSNAVRHYIASILKNQLNCKSVHQAMNAKDALRLIESSVKIDWIFSDWEMPVMNGDEFLMKIRDNPVTSKIPFIMITARNDKDSLIAAAQAGVTDYLVKPFTASILMNKVRRILSLQERRTMERFLAHSSNKVDVVFTGSKKFSGALISVSMSGCLIITQLYKGSDICVHDTAEIRIADEEETLVVKGELLRIENYRDTPTPRLMLQSAFQFTEVDEANREKLKIMVAHLSSLIDKKGEEVFDGD